MDEKIEETNLEAKRLWENLEQQVKDYEKIKESTAKQTERIIKIKYWLVKYPKAVKNMKNKEAKRKEEGQEEEEVIEMQSKEQADETTRRSALE